MPGSDPDPSVKGSNRDGTVPTSWGRGPHRPPRPRWRRNYDSLKVAKCLMLESFGETRQRLYHKQAEGSQKGMRQACVSGCSRNSPSLGWLRTGTGGVPSLRRHRWLVGRPPPGRHPATPTTPASHAPRVRGLRGLLPRRI
ncbi:hypothetical protein PUN28_017889 [Cardiocondyla obscurior]|uniref:Uncharacterized protein n=1 Tax=Cardiocondyla obscurior TaxID=286306 RepID=A0AAW2EPR2_9HYME